MKNTTDYLNAMLFTLLGDHELINKWWANPNRAFGMQCPEDVDKNLIKSYLESLCFR